MQQQKASRRLLLEILGGLLIFFLTLSGCAFWASLNSSQSYTQGVTDGQQRGNTIGYQQGQKDGYTTGYQAGKRDGYTNGQTDGYARGHDQGEQDALQTLYDWANGSGCSQYDAEGYILFHLWRDSWGNIKYTCLIRTY